MHTTRLGSGWFRPATNLVQEREFTADRSPCLLCSHLPR